MKTKHVILPTRKQMTAACEKRGLMFPNHSSSRSKLQNSSKSIGRKTGGYINPLKLGLEEWPEE